MAKSDLCCFHNMFELCLENNKPIKKVSIPIIQRDYAQGRDTNEIKRIRSRFLKALYDAVEGPAINLDFVYGDFNDDGVLIPLDGQQRLTTLFLLHWFAAKKEKVDASEYEFLKKFTYETRYSSRDFCEKLIDFNPTFNKEISEEIKNQAWFPYDWENDPTIGSMLVVLDDIQKIFKCVSNLWDKLVNQNKISFYFLPIRNMGLSDELYIKMNSRGKPLTTFEHFKAEFEHQIKLINKNMAKIFEDKIDGKWTNFLWNYRNDCNYLIDDLFLNYFKFICDVICYESNKSPQNRSYDEFDLIHIYFSENNPNATENLNFFEKALDVWTENFNVFKEFLSFESEPDKAKIVNSVNRIDLLKDCLLHYSDSQTGRRSRSFPFSKFILLYAFLQFVLNREKIDNKQFEERIRIVNNLVLNSDDEMNDSENRVGGNRLPSILAQTKSIIVDGKILSNISINFNSHQLEEEEIKQRWRRENKTKVASLNLLENHELLLGQISVVGVENCDLFDRFTELFKCNEDKISCALLTFGDYSRKEKSYIYQFGTSGEYYQQTWRDVFHQSSSKGFETTKDCLVKLLKSSQNFTNDILDEFINKYIKDCEINSIYDWRYYFIKYPFFRPNRYGKYFINGDNKYLIDVLWSAKKLSENAYQPFLKSIDDSHIDKFYLGERLNYGDKFVYCQTYGFALKDVNGEIIKTLKVNQNSEGIDTEDRIKKYKNNPLI
ncbi:DUF262 domain-containing protein [bacterium]|nr:DUF262 domain-containing protein [bacterium]